MEGINHTPWEPRNLVDPTGAEVRCRWLERHEPYPRIVSFSLHVKGKKGIYSLLPRDQEREPWATLFSFPTHQCVCDDQLHVTIPVGLHCWRYRRGWYWIEATHLWKEQNPADSEDDQEQS